MAVRRPVLLLAATCLAFVALAASFYLIDRLPAGMRGSALIAVQLGLTACMLTAWWLSVRHKVVRPRLLFAAAFVSQLLVLGVSPFTTSDVDRYLWDGRVALEGLNPYQTRPDDQEVSHLHERWPTAVEHASYPTIYPPLAMISFSAAALAGPEHAKLVWKIIALAAATVVLLACWRAMVLAGSLPHYPLIALSPLLLVEGGIGTHVDVIMAAFVALALLALTAHRPLMVALSMGLGAAVKFLPGLLLLPWLPHHGWRRGLMLGGAALLTVAALYGLGALLGWHSLGSLPVFIEKWRFGSPMWRFLEPSLGASMLPFAVIAGGSVGIAITLALLRQGRDHAAMLALPMVALMASPVIFPWYLLALLPCFVLVRSYTLLAWIIAVPFTYEVIDSYDVDGSWDPAVWPLLLIALAWLVGGLLDFYANRLDSWLGGTPQDRLTSG